MGDRSSLGEIALRWARSRGRSGTCGARRRNWRGEAPLPARAVARAAGDQGEPDQVRCLPLDKWALGRSPNLGGSLVDDEDSEKAPQAVQERPSGGLEGRQSRRAETENARRGRQVEVRRQRALRTRHRKMETRALGDLVRHRRSPQGKRRANDQRCLPGSGRPECWRPMRSSRQAMRWPEMIIWIAKAGGRLRRAGPSQIRKRSPGEATVERNLKAIPD